MLTYEKILPEKIDENETILANLGDDVYSFSILLSRKPDEKWEKIFYKERDILKLNKEQSPKISAQSIVLLCNFDEFESYFEKLKIVIENTNNQHYEYLCDLERQKQDKDTKKEMLKYRIKNLNKKLGLK